MSGSTNSLPILDKLEGGNTQAIVTSSNERPPSLSLSVHESWTYPSLAILYRNRMKIAYASLLAYRFNIIILLQTHAFTASIILPGPMHRRD